MGPVEGAVGEAGRVGCAGLCAFDAKKERRMPSKAAKKLLAGHWYVDFPC